MYPEESRLLDECFDYLTRAVAATVPPRSTLGPTHLDAVCHLLERWPPSAIFPGTSALCSCSRTPISHTRNIFNVVMDLTRLIIAFCPLAYADSVMKTRLLAAMLRAAEWSEPWSAPQPKQRETNVTFLLRGIANALQDDMTPDAISGEVVYVYFF